MISLSIRKVLFGFALCFFFYFFLIVPCLAEEIPYGIGQWETDSLVNHRVVIHVS